MDPLNIILVDDHGVTYAPAVIQQKMMRKSSLHHTTRPLALAYNGPKEKGNSIYSPSLVFLKQKPSMAPQQ